jgi:hypothetical protein
VHASVRSQLRLADLFVVCPPSVSVVFVSSVRVSSLLSVWSCVIFAPGGQAVAALRAAGGSEAVRQRQ